ncbi:hypothetical protein [Shewanella sp. W3-18-1]|uniref:hypothetical protein n=1 Tax=Shewanella sp. (strain W3-18-1) TaxID=351745 RepID=UPI00005FC904|nr:hypothetical protein [Shewanella sp. W3-18-1]ABM25138.1 hypothetical protein Sputw3181_2314 [Shewanella sp. W3-18-1]
MLAKFLNKRSRSRKHMRDYAKNVFEYDQYLLTDYIDSGMTDGFERVKQYREFDEDFRQWELFGAEFGVPECHWGYVAQLTYIESGLLEPKPLMCSLAYGYFATAIEYYKYCSSIEKTGGIANAMWSTISVFRLVLMLLAGLKSEADELYHADATARRSGWIVRSHGFIGDFLVLLYGRYLGHIEPPFTTEVQVTLRKTAPFPYASFLDNWDTQDIEFISTMLQTLCDDQVEQAIIGDKKCFFEFHNGHLSYIPLTALMLLKLRDLRGLPNPQFSHPAFGDVTALFEQVCTAFSDYVAAEKILRIEDAADEVLTNTLTRMQSQDFDAHAIFAKRLPSFSAG